MPDFLVGSGQTYTTLQGAVDTVVALGDLAGLGDHNIIIDDAFTHNGAIDFTGLQAKSDGRVFIKSAGTYTLTLSDQLLLPGYVTIRDFIASANVGFTDADLIKDNNSVGNIVEEFTLYNPNTISVTAFRGSANWRTNTVRNGKIYGFSGANKYGIIGANAVSQVIVNGSDQGILSCVTVTDCVAINCSTNDFGSNTTVSYCASSDTTASGTGSITNIVAADEFTDPDNGDFSLKAGSQLIEAGSTGNNIGWDQNVPVSTDPEISLSGVYAPGQVITATLSNFAGTPTQATLTDTGNNSVNVDLTADGNDYTFTIPDLPDAGNDTAGLLFGDVTVSITDPGA